VYTSDITCTSIVMFTFESSSTGEHKPVGVHVTVMLHLKRVVCLIYILSIGIIHAHLLGRLGEQLLYILYTGDFRF
jgi:hypothetical protein